jgi:hypothetical protein
MRAFFGPNDPGELHMPWSSVWGSPSQSFGRLRRVGLRACWNVPQPRRVDMHEPSQLVSRLCG